MKNSRQSDAYVDPVNMDELATYTDDALYLRLRQLESLISKMSRRFGVDTRQIEDEVAYVLREVGIRADRREAYSQYESYGLSDDHYESGDFDNSEYVRLHSMWKKPKCQN